MHPLPNPVGQPTHGQDVASAVKGKRIRLAQALAGKDFVFDRVQARVVGLEWVRSRHRH